MTYPRYTDLLRTLPATVPFVGPEEQERERGRAFGARLGANEQNFGPSPKAIEAMRNSAAEIWKYPDSTSHGLRRAIAETHAIAPENILVGEGIDGILGYLVRMLVAPGDAVVTSDGAYPTFNYHVVGFGGALHKVPYKGDHEDPAALFAKAREVNAKLVYLSNPDNPMGSWYKGADIVTAMDDLHEDCLFVLDEAYVEFAPEGTAAPLNADDPRVIRTGRRPRGPGPRKGETNGLDRRTDARLDRARDPRLRVSALLLRGRVLGRARDGALGADALGPTHPAHRLRPGELARA